MRSMKAVSSRISGGSGLKVCNPLLLLDIHVEIADHDDASFGPDILLAAAKLAGRHVAFHDVDAVLLVEGDARHFIEADHVVLTYETALTVRIVDKHLGDGRLAARDEMGIGRNLLEQVALAGAPRSEFDQIVVALHKRDNRGSRQTEHSEPSTMRIFSSEEYLRVARRMVFTSRSDDDSNCPDFCLISTP